jgi:hypothetical protein
MMTKFVICSGGYMNNVPQELDWVDARARCSLIEVFKALRLGAESDVQTINEKRQSENGVTFQVTDNTAGDVFVVSQADALHKEIKFYLGKDHIAIKGRSQGDLIVTITLNDDGRCKLRANDGPDLEQWQVRRMVLEKLFFGPFGGPI